MNIMHLKKLVLSILSVIVISASFPIAYAEGEDSNSLESALKTIDSIDNSSGTLVLNDFIYKMKLNTKVYDPRKRLTNRYALRKGQQVIVEVDEQGPKGPGRLIDSISIVGQ